MSGHLWISKNTFDPPPDMEKHLFEKARDLYDDWEEKCEAFREYIPDFCFDTFYEPMMASIVIMENTSIEEVCMDKLNDQQQKTEKIDSNGKKQLREETNNNYYDDLLVLQEKHPGFSLEAEIKNDKFCLLLMRDLSPVSAYEIIHSKQS